MPRATIARTPSKAAKRAPRRRTKLHPLEAIAAELQSTTRRVLARDFQLPTLPSEIREIDRRLKDLVEYPIGIGKNIQEEQASARKLARLDLRSQWTVAYLVLNVLESPYAWSLHARLTPDDLMPFPGPPLPAHPVNNSFLVRSVFLTPLHFEASAGNIQGVLHLLAHGAEIDRADTKGATALHRAAEAGRAEVVALLIDRGSDWNATDKAAKRPIDVATDPETFAVLQARRFRRGLEIELDGPVAAGPGPRSL